MYFISIQDVHFCPLNIFVMQMTSSLFVRGRRDWLGIAIAGASIVFFSGLCPNKDKTTICFSKVDKIVMESICSYIGFSEGVLSFQ